MLGAWPHPRQPARAAAPRRPGPAHRTRGSWLAPAPAGAVRAAERATFRLTPNEAAYLLERLTGAVPGSLLGWLLGRPRQRRRWAARVWQERLPGLPADLAQAIDHGRRLSQVMYGAAVLYNLLLAEAATATQRADDYRGLLEAWADELSSSGACVGWTGPACGGSSMGKTLGSGSRRKASWNVGSTSPRDTLSASPTTPRPVG